MSTKIQKMVDILALNQRINKLINFPDYFSYNYYYV